MRKENTNGRGRAAHKAARLSENHLHDLRRSGLSDSQITAGGFFTEDDPAAVGQMLHWEGPAHSLGPCLVIPYSQPDGLPADHRRLKPDKPRTDKDGRPIKYESPRAVATKAYFPPGFCDRWASTEAPVVVTEGEKKAAKATQEGFCCIGIPGVWSWQQKRPRDENGVAHGTRELIADLAALNWQGRKVVVIFDSDAAEKPNVRRAEQQLAEAMTAQGAVVRVVRLPPAPGLGKVGLDDYLVAHGAGALRRLMAPPTVSPPAAFVPFPTEALPPPLQALVTQGAAAIGCDASYLALPALSVTAALIGNARVIRLKRSWYEPSVVWSGIVGDSGTLKSPAVNAVMAPLYKLQKALLKKHRADLELYEKDKALHDERKKKAQKEGKEFTTEPPERPTLPRVVTGDVTIEKLAELLADNPKGLLTCRDELGGWLASFTRYKGRAGGSDLPNWLELHRAGTVQVDRKTGDRPTLFIPHAAVSVCGGIQPGALARALTPDFFDSGLVARLVMAWPAKRKKKWTEDEIDEGVQQAYRRTLEDLYALQLDCGDDGEREPFVVKLTPEAKGVWERFFDGWAAEQAAVEGEMAAALSKLEGYAARLALLHHVVSRVGAMTDCEPIEPVSVEAGVTLVRWFAQETRRIYTILRESTEASQTRKLIEFVRMRDGAVTARELHKANRARFPDAGAAEAALDALALAGLGAWLGRTPGQSGGRPTRAFHLHRETPKPRNPETSDEDDDDDAQDGGGDAPKPTPKPPPPPQNSAESEVSGVFGVSATSPLTSDGPDAPTTDESTPPLASGEVSGCGPKPGDTLAPETNGDGNLSARTKVCGADNGLTATRNAVAADKVPFTLVTDAAGLAAVVGAVAAASGPIGLDVETTGLDPRRDRTRLIQLAVPGHDVFLIDCSAVDPRPLWTPLAAAELVVHNAVFDIGFLWRLGFRPGRVYDLLLMSRLLTAGVLGAGNSLAALAAQELGVVLDKTRQTDDWSAPQLTREQLDYAALDALVTRDLYPFVRAKVEAAALERVAEIENRAVPAFVWMAAAGAPFDPAAWEALTAEAERDAAGLVERLDAAAPPRPAKEGKEPHRQAKSEHKADPREGKWNWRSGPQVAAVFALLGVKLPTSEKGNPSTSDAVLAGIDRPLAALLRGHRRASQMVKAFGRTWLDCVDAGRIHAGWNPHGAASGRASCSAPNLQQVPRDPRYRRCFVAPPGRVLIKADYCQIELRIAAQIADDKAMLDAYDRGEDLHAATARRVLGVEEVAKEDRQLAKALNFGLLYGMGARTLRAYALKDYGVVMSDDEAAAYRAGFFATYPGLAAWHAKALRFARRARFGLGGPGESRTLAGRRRLFDAKTPFTFRLNSPVQGGGADGLKTALGLLWERRADCPGAVPVLAVHDEIVVEADADEADAAAEWLKQAMIDGMAPLLAPVPVQVDVVIGKTWAGA